LLVVLPLPAASPIAPWAVAPSAGVPWSAPNGFALLPPHACTASKAKALSSATRIEDGDSVWMRNIGAV
jgi:hypothetical protein